MGIPYYKRAGAVVTGTTGVVSPAWPTHVAGDVALLVVEANWGSTGTQNPIGLTDAQGFVQIGSTVTITGTGSLGGTQLAVFWCRATSAAMSAPSVQANNDHIIARIVTFGDCVASGDPFHATASGTSAASTSHALPGLTTTIDDCLAVLAMATHNDSSTLTVTGWTNGDLGDPHQAVQDTTGTANGGGFAVGVGNYETAGTFGTTAVTTSASSNVAMLTIALAPVGSEAEAPVEATPVDEGLERDISTFAPGVDLELDDDGDLVVDTDAHFTQDLAAVAQGIRIRVQMFQGEWFADLDTGVPYFQDILGQKFNELKVRAAFRDAILDTPGVDELAALSVTFDRSTRTARVVWNVKGSFGSIVDSLEV